MKSPTMRMALASIVLLTACAISVLAQEPAAMSVNTQPTRAQAEDLVAHANTPQEHLQLAAYFRNEAHEAEQMAETHDKMANGYMVNPVTGKTTQLQMHCKEVADMARKAAAADNEMAEEHEKIAAHLEHDMK